MATKTIPYTLKFLRLTFDFGASNEGTFLDFMSFNSIRKQIEWLSCIH